MWAHYAAAHTGICVGFDAMGFVKHLEGCENDKLQFMIGPVTYQEENPHLDSDAWTHQNTEAFCLTKSAHWSYEREHRILFYQEPDANIERAHVIPS